MSFRSASRFVQVTATVLVILGQLFPGLVVLADEASHLVDLAAEIQNLESVLMEAEQAEPNAQPTAAPEAATWTFQGNILGNARTSYMNDPLNGLAVSLYGSANSTSVGYLPGELYHRRLRE